VFVRVLESAWGWDCALSGAASWGTRKVVCGGAFRSSRLSFVPLLFFGVGQT
jgi:hypothetical protein